MNLVCKAQVSLVLVKDIQSYKRYYQSLSSDDIAPPVPTTKDPPEPWRDTEPDYDGTNGKDGQDAISLIITSSNGLIFKNTAISTTLSAHVYKGPTEITGSALSTLGTLNWYKDDSSKPVGTGTSLVIDVGDVKDRATYVCQLED